LKIQLKRSNVLEGGVAKTPTAGQMEFGELAVNYSSLDPVIFIKDSDNNIIRITNDSAYIQDLIDATVKDGEININAGDGLVATGDNATANQAANTTREFAVVADAGYGLAATATGIRIEGAWTNIPVLPTV
jgi:hypothetical protein